MNSQGQGNLVVKPSGSFLLSIISGQKPEKSQVQGCSQIAVPLQISSFPCWKGYNMLAEFSFLILSPALRRSQVSEIWSVSTFWNLCTQHVPSISPRAAICCCPDGCDGLFYRTQMSSFLTLEETSGLVLFSPPLPSTPYNMSPQHASQLPWAMVCLQKRILDPELLFCLYSWETRGL